MLGARHRSPAASFATSRRGRAWVAHRLWRSPTSLADAHERQPPPNCCCAHRSQLSSGGNVPATAKAAPDRRGRDGHSSGPVSQCDGQPRARRPSPARRCFASWARHVPRFAESPTSRSRPTAGTLAQRFVVIASGLRARPTISGVVGLKIQRHRRAQTISASPSCEPTSPRRAHSCKRGGAPWAPSRSAGSTGLVPPP